MGCWPLHEKKELKQDTEECCYMLSAARAVPPLTINCQNTKMDVVREMSDKFKVSMNVKQQQPIYDIYIYNYVYAITAYISVKFLGDRLKPDSSPHLSLNCISFIPHTRWIISAYLPDPLKQRRTSEKTVHLRYITARGDRRQRMERFKGPGSLFIFYKSALYGGVVSERR